MFADSVMASKIFTIQATICMPRTIHDMPTTCKSTMHHYVVCTAAATMYDVCRQACRVHWQLDIVWQQRCMVDADDQWQFRNSSRRVRKGTLSTTHSRAVVLHTNCVRMCRTRSVFRRAQRCWACRVEVMLTHARSPNNSPVSAVKRIRSTRRHTAMITTIIPAVGAR